MAPDQLQNWELMYGRMHSLPAIITLVLGIIKGALITSRKIEDYFL